MDNYFSGMDVYVPQIIGTLIAIVLWYICKLVTGKVVMRYGIRLQKSEIRRNRIKQVIKIMLNIIFIIIIAIIWGVQTKNLLVALSSIFAVLGVALFAQWSILSNITAGIIMYFGAPFRIGDKIKIIDKDMPIEAMIENIYTFYTHIRTPEKELIVLPNSIFLQKIVSISDQEDYSI